MIGFPLVIVDSKQDMPGIEPGPLGWYTSKITTGLQEVTGSLSFYGGLFLQRPVDRDLTSQHVDSHDCGDLLAS